MELVLNVGDILTAKTDIIAYPSDSAGHVGEATIVDGKIVAPTMVHANEPIPVKQVELATVAALRCADEAGYASVALPAFGTGVGDVVFHEAAKVMMETIQMFRCDNKLARVEIWLPHPAAKAEFEKHAF